MYLLATPTFIEEPENEIKAEEEDVTFVCRAGGKPRPNVEWSINGIPIESKYMDDPSSLITFLLAQ